ncbi:winged helix-turn-helix domain-containing protein [Micromonospora sp. NPDC047548]|uniref:GntR family transcriptional regulator n=1 Tax=Micromonospora sp. NPDC047548 TaxID=3155624 RepID=UPI0034071E9A
MNSLQTYRQIADGIAARIANGDLPAGTLLPSYQQLAAAHGVSIATTQRAYALLGFQGLVYGEPGQGVYVADHAAAATA